MDGSRNSVKGLEDFSLLGGPLHRLGLRLGLVRRARNTLLLGLAVGVALWVILIVLALVEGYGHLVCSLSVVGVHIRLLAVIPLLFLCETWFDPKLPSFLGMLVQSGIVRGNALSALESEIARTTRWNSSWLAEVMCALAALVLSLVGPPFHLGGTSAAYDPSHGAKEFTFAGHWYWLVCLPLFRYLMIRWLWRLGLWSHFLWRLSRLDLHLVPTHPDGSAGLGYLEIVHVHFVPLILALSAVQASSLAEDLATGKATFEAVYPALAIVLLVDVVLFLGPLLLFLPKLWACRVKGMSDYMEFAEKYVSDFDGKWLRGQPATGEPLLGTPDLQSLADLSNSVNIVRNMRRVPVSLNMLKDYGIAALLPMLPLLLLEYPVAELAQRFLGRLGGL